MANQSMQAQVSPGIDPSTLPEGFDVNKVAYGERPSNSGIDPSSLPEGFDVSRATSGNKEPEPQATPGWWDKTKDVVGRYGQRLAQSVGLPSTKEEWEAAKPKGLSETIIDPEVLGGPAVTAGKILYNYGKTALQGAKEAGKEAYEAGENIGEGSPVAPQLGKAGHAVSHAVLQATPFIGPAIETAGEDIASGNYAGAAGGLTGVVGQVIVPELAERVVPKIGAKQNLVGREYIPENLRKAQVPAAKPSGIPRIEYASPTPAPVESGYSQYEPNVSRAQEPVEVVPTEQKPAGALPRIEYASPTEFTPEEKPITKEEVKSSPGTSMAETKVEPKSAVEVHGDMRQRVSELSNADLKSLGESFGLNPEEYDFAKREALREGGSKHPIDRYRFVDDLVGKNPGEGRIPDSWLETFGRLSEEAKQRQGLFSDKDITSQKRAAQSRAIFRDKLGIPEATEETRNLSEADLLKRGFTQRDIDAGLHLPSVGGGSAAAAAPGVQASIDPSALLKRWGVDEGSLTRGREQTRGQAQDVTEAEVQKLVDRYKNGQPVDPVVEYRDENNNVIEVDGRMRAIAATRAGVKRIPIKVVRPHVYDKGGVVSIKANEPEELVPTAAKSKGSILGSAMTSARGEFSGLTKRVMKALGLSDEAKAGLAGAGLTEDQTLRELMARTPAEIEAKYGKAA